MEITCPTCNKVYNIASHKVPEGRKISTKCKECGGRIVVEARIEETSTTTHKAAIKEKSISELKHSKVGIASFIISIVSGVLMFVIIVYATVMEASQPGGLDEASATAVIIGLLMFLFLGTSLLASGLGITGLFQKKRKKIFAILGTVFSVMTIVVTISLMILGWSME